MLVVDSLHTERRSFSNLLPRLLFWCLLSCFLSSFDLSSPPSLPSPLLIPSALRSPVIFSFSRLPLPLHSSFTSSPPSLLSLTLLSSFPLSFLPHPPLLPFTLLPLSSLSLLSCPAAERLQSEPSHLYPSPPLYNHPQNALMR